MDGVVSKISKVKKPIVMSPSFVQFVKIESVNVRTGSAANLLLLLLLLQSVFLIGFTVCKFLLSSVLETYLTSPKR